MSNTTEVQTQSTTEAIAAPERLSPLAIQRSRRIADSLEVMNDRNIQFINDGAMMTPGQGYFQAIEQFVHIVASDPDVPYPSTQWSLLEKSTELAKAIYSQMSEWRESVSNQVIKAVTATFEHIDSVRDPKPASPPKIVELEGIEELDAIIPKVSASQIAIMYDWYTPDGQPDISKVRRCRAGEIESPRYKVFEQVRSRMPHLGIVDSLATDFRQFADDENALSAVMDPSYDSLEIGDDADD